MNQPTNRRAVLLSMAALAAALAASPASAAPKVDARKVHDSVLVLDSHVDILLPDAAPRYQAPGGGSRASLEQLTAGGVDALVLAIAVGGGPDTEEAYAAARKTADEKLTAIQAFIASSGGKVEQARTPDEVEQIYKRGHIAVVLGFQNARSLGPDLVSFDAYYKAGVRVAALTHAGNNIYADSSRPQASEGERNGGLTDLGKQAIKRFNDLGVLVDVTQLSTAALMQTLAISRAPVVATHSDARALVNNPRNLTDAELDAIAAKGGVVQLTPFNSYVHKITPEERAGIEAIRVQYGLPKTFAVANEGAAIVPEAQRAAFTAALTAAQIRGTVSEFVDHLDYVARRIGADHVGIGSDFNHGSGINGFDGEKDAPNVTAELVKRGYTQKQIAGIWGGNFLRVWREAQAKAAR
jgi:membrane dipeptidase